MKRTTLTLGFALALAAGCVAPKKTIEDVMRQPAPSGEVAKPAGDDAKRALDTQLRGWDNPYLYMDIAYKALQGNNYGDAIANYLHAHYMFDGNAYGEAAAGVGVAAAFFRHRDLSPARTNVVNAQHALAVFGDSLAKDPSAALAMQHLDDASGGIDSLLAGAASPDSAAVDSSLIRAYHALTTAPGYNPPEQGR
ncbi:MAG: hypothetical protein V1735_00775 [Nanoarchaeota archaeon]